MCTDQASGLNIVPHRHGYDLINERMPPAVSAGPCGNQNKRKNSSNPSAAWVIMIVWVPLRLAAFCLSPIRTIIGRGLDGTVALAKRNDAIRPANAKRRDVKKILNVAALHFEELAGLWEEI